MAWSWRKGNGNQRSRDSAHALAIFIRVTVNFWLRANRLQYLYGLLGRWYAKRYTRKICRTSLESIGKKISQSFGKSISKSDPQRMETTWEGRTADRRLSVAWGDKKVTLRSRYIRIIKEDISYVDLKEIRTFPFFNFRSNKSGLIAEEKNARQKPFGNLATRTVGSVYKDLEKRLGQVDWSLNTIRCCAEFPVWKIVRKFRVNGWT